MKYLGLWSPGLRFFFFLIFKILSPPLLLLHTYRTLPFNARVEDSSIKDFVLSITLQV